MSDVVYASAVGFIQFDPQEREVNGQTVRDITIKTPGEAGKLIRITVWPEWAVDLNKGDFVAVDGKLTVGAYKGRDGEERQSIQLSTSSLVVVPGAKRAERGVVNSGGNESSDLGF